MGTGTFGVVKKGRHIHTKKEVAIKIVNKARTEKSGSTVLIEREISILKQVKHPNVIECYEVIETESNWYMIMELISGGELLDYIDDRAWVSEKEASKFFTQIIAGVKAYYFGERYSLLACLLFIVNQMQHQSEFAAIFQ